MIQLRGGIFQADARESCSGIEAVEVFRPIFRYLDILPCWATVHNFHLTIVRLDVELAMQSGTPTLFRCDEVPVHPVLCNPDASSGQLPGTIPWMPLMQDLLSFSRLLNVAEAKQTAKPDPLDYTETLLWLLYQLVEGLLPRYTSTKSGGLCGEVTYLAMLAFMTKLLPDFTRDNSSWPLLSDHLGNAIQRHCLTASGSSIDNLRLLLWILFISGISVLNHNSNQWLTPLIADTCEKLELVDWTAVQGQLSQFPWIFALHETPGRRLWEDIQLGNREISWDISLRESSL